MSSQPPNEPRAIPHAGRPRGAAWRALQAEGIEWEGQVLLGAADRALSARLIVTTERLAFARGGDVVLDIDRRWLRQAPYLSGNGAVNLRIETGNGQRDRLQFSARDGRQVATDFVNLMVNGPDDIEPPDYEPQFNRVPERRRSALPADPSFPTELVATPLEHTYTSDVIDATTLQVLDPTDFPPVTEAASPSTNRANAPEGGRGSSDPITISTLGNQAHRAGEWSLNPIPALAPSSTKISRAGWAFRLSGLVLLLALVGLFGTNRLPGIPGLNRDTFIAAPNNTTPTQENVALLDPTHTPTTDLRATETINAAETSISLGVGSETIASTPSPTATTDTAVGSADDLATATEPAVIDPVETATTAPTDVLPTATEVVEEAVATDTATLAPTATETAVLPTDTPTATETAVPVETATLAATDTATIEPTATASPTETATLEPTATPTPGFPSQEPSVPKDESPDQVFATGAFRYTVEFAERGAEIPTLELNAVDGQDWVVVVLYAWNWSDEPATLNMADFQVLVSGDFGWQFIGMDAASTEIGQYLGFDPVLEPTELASIKDGEGIRMALVYSIPNTTTGMELIDDTSGLNLSESLAIGGDVTALGSAPEAPELVGVTVTEVLDGRTIVVQDADGYTATIQYLGINVPTGDACFAGDSTTTNSNITLGQTVYLEREYRNRLSGESDVLVRDVWIDNGQGGLVLVAAWMASEGAAVASPMNQDTRFAGWIQAAAGAAEANAYGFWSTCGAEPVGPESSDAVTDDPTNAVLPVDPLVDYDQ